MGHFDLTLSVELISVVAAVALSALFLAHGIFRRIRREAEIYSRFNSSPQGSRIIRVAGTETQRTAGAPSPRGAPRPLVSALRIAIVALPLGLLGLAAVAHMSQALAQDATTQQAALPAEPAAAPAPEATGQALIIDTSFLTIESPGWRSDADFHSPDRQARIQSCYLTARAAHEGDGDNSGFGDTRRLSDLNRSVSNFYKDQQQRDQFDGCIR